MAESPTTASPLEGFFLRYVEHTGGVWDEIEPQVYDVILPSDVEEQLGWRSTNETVRAAFDPEALNDHPAAQLMVFGNPTLDLIFQHAQAASQVAKVYLTGFNLAPHHLSSLVERGLQVPAGVTVSVLSRRPMHFLSALWWFQATYVSDEKVEDMIEVGTDLHYERPARHLEEVLRTTAVMEARPIAYPDATAIPLVQGYALAREEATRVVTVAAHERQGELQRRLGRESERISRYFADLRAELDDRTARAKEAEDIARFEAQQGALNREEQAQLNELRRKMTLSAQLRLLNVLLIVQPKLIVRTQLAPKKAMNGEITLTWDPALQKLDAPVCPSCGRPSLALAVTSAGQVVCADCAQSGHAGRR